MEQFPSTNPNPVFRVGGDGIILYSNRAGETLLRAWNVGIGAHLPPSLENFVQKVFFRNVSKKLEIKVKDRIYLVSFHPLLKEGYVNIYGFDISAQKGLEEKLRKKEKQYDVLHKIGRMALTYESLQAFMDKSVKLVARTLELEYCKILELLPDGNFLLRAGVGWKPGYVGKYIIEGKKESQAGYTLLSNSSVLVENFEDETRFRAPFFLKEHDVVSGMSVIIGSVEKPYGVLGAHSTKKRKFTEEDTYFLNSVAFLIAGVIEHRQTEEKLMLYRGHLEELVKERTSELTKTNKQLFLEVAGRKEVEKELQNNINFLETFLDAIPSPVFYRDLDYVYQTCNEMFSSFILGLTKEEVIGKSMYDFKDQFPDEMVRISEHYDRLLLKDGISQPHEVRIRCADGKVRDFLIHKARYSNVSGEVIGIVGILLDITERKKAEKALQETENLRKKEIHHRIKNNLQVISSLLSLQAEQFSDEKVIEAFEESKSRVISMSLIHEELYKTEGAESLDFTSYLRRLATDLLRSYKVGGEDIRLKLGLEKVFLGMDTAIPLGIIVNELISNSLKHAFPEGKSGEIRIELHREKNSEKPRIMLIVSDNGKGLPESIDFRNTFSLGFQLVTTLVDQIEGSIKLEKGLEEGRGTKFTISLREKE